MRLRALLICIYATLWGMGGHLSGEESRTAYSDFIRQVRRWERIALVVGINDIGHNSFDIEVYSLHHFIPWSWKLHP